MKHLGLKQIKPIEINDNRYSTDVYSRAEEVVTCFEAETACLLEVGRGASGYTILTKNEFLSNTTTQRHCHLHQPWHPVEFSADAHSQTFVAAQ